MLLSGFAGFHGLLIDCLAGNILSKNNKNQPLNCCKGGADHEQLSMLCRTFAVYIKFAGTGNLAHMKLTLPRLFAGVFALWVLTFVAIFLSLPDWQSRGQFGDLFGSVNSLFSGLAFVGIFWALRLQQEQLSLQQTELRLQREELKLQREEMAASRSELANQVKAQKSLFRASVAQIAVASAQAQIEAIKMDSEQTHPSGRQNYVHKIESVAQALAKLADKVEDFDKSAG